MEFFEEGAKTKAEKEGPDWYDRIIKAGLLVVAILGIVQDRTWWLPYAFVFVLVLLGYPTAKSVLKRWKRRQLRNRALRTYYADFKSYTLQLSQFVEDSNTYSIPIYLRNILSKLDPDLANFSSNVEYVFGSTLRHLKSHILEGAKNFEEFDRMSSELSDLLSSLVMVYVEEVTRLIRKEDNRTKISSSDLADLKKRYDAFLRLVDNYNGFRRTLAVFLGETNASWEIRVPYQAFE